MSAWIEGCIAELARRAEWGYHHGGPAASEPTALAALVLAARGRRAEASRAADWLQASQSEDGSVGVSRQQRTPGWPTSLAVLAWSAVLNEDTNPKRKRGSSRESSLTLRVNMSRAIDWLMAAKGEIVTETEPLSHDRTLVGWPWIDGTHSWVEPTALCVLALKAEGHDQHPRTREAVRLLVDRLLPTGGCNYGNTFVLGQKLLPHVQPTGLCLLALAGESVVDPRIARSINYLHQSLADGTAATSLSYGLLGLTAHGAQPKQAADWLATAYQRVNRKDASPYKLALLALAAMQTDCPLIALTRRAA